MSGTGSNSTVDYLGPDVTDDANPATAPQDGVNKLWDITLDRTPVPGAFSCGGPTDEGGINVRLECAKQGGTFMTN